MAPAVSVVMPMYNAVRHLSEAVESILVQTFDDFEFVIVDDGSTDRSPEIAARYASEDERIHMVCQSNQGVVGALNRGLQEAKAPLVARMDADDIAFPERLERQVAFLHAHPECVLVGGQVCLMDGEGEEITEGWGHNTLKELPLEHELIDRALLQAQWPLVHPAVLMRRESVEAAGAYYEQHEGYEDHDLFLRLAEVGRLANLPETVLWYRRHAAQATQNSDSVPFFPLKYLARDAYRRRGLPLPRSLKLLRARRFLKKLPPQVEQSLMSMKSIFSRDA